MRKNVEQNSSSVDYKDLRASVQKPTDNLQLQGAVEYSKKQSLEVSKSSGGKQRAVRKRTWTKEEAAEIQAERATMVRHEDNLKLLEGKFEGRQVAVHLP